MSFFLLKTLEIICNNQFKNFLFSTLIDEFFDFNCLNSNKNFKNLLNCTLRIACQTNNNQFYFDYGDSTSESILILGKFIVNYS